MSGINEIKYIKCLNCGKYINVSDAYKNKYCTLACSSNFSKCSNCGSFYLKIKGYSNKYCTIECAKKIESSKN